MLGGLFLNYRDTIVDLKAQLGNQLSSLFAFFLCNHNISLSKEKIIDTFWSDSENPANALKFAIFRLRNALKKIDGFDDNFVKTVGGGYQINKDISFSIDIEELEQAMLEAKRNNDLSLYKRVIEIYNGPFLEGIDADWAQIDKGYYSSLILEACNTLCGKYVENGNIKEAISVAEKGLSFDDLDEQLITSYLRALVLNQNYNQAMTYYQYINKKYKEVLGVSLESSGGNKFAAILSNAPNKKKVVSSSLIDTNDISGPLFVDGVCFNSICMYVIRNMERIEINAYLLKIKLNNKSEQILDEFQKVLELVFRKSDVISKTNEDEFALLLNLRRDSDKEIIEKRLQSRMSKKISDEFISMQWQKL